MAPPVSLMKSHQFERRYAGNIVLDELGSDNRLSVLLIRDIDLLALSREPEPVRRNLGIAETGATEQPMSRKDNQPAYPHGCRQPDQPPAPGRDRHVGEERQGERNVELAAGCKILRAGLRENCAH